MPKYVLEPLKDDGLRGPRLEIDELLIDNDLANLFLQALRNIQLNSLTEVNGGMNMFNHYALSAVHGAPREEWNGYENRAGRYGYCHHSEDTFPTWHRPYMMSYEIAIYKEMLNIAGQYSDAAQKTDPIMPRNKRDPNGAFDTVFGLPVIYQQKQVFVRTPKKPNELTPMANPLYEFTFPKGDDWGAHPDRLRLTISRWFNQEHTARTLGDRTGESDHAYLDLEVRRQASTLATKIWKMLNPDEFVNKTRPWNSFVNDSINSVSIQGRRFATQSFEGWHDDIHVMVGQGRSKDRARFVGQMGDPAYAAFDPILWMHHNIDRLLSLYQPLYGKNVEGELIKRELILFTKNAQTEECFTSADGVVKNYWAPGFAVPGTKEDKSGTIKEIVKKYLTNAYCWATTKEQPGDQPLADWPKDVKSLSEAVSGKTVKKNPNARVVFTSVSASAAEPIKLEETPIKTAKILETVNSINKSLPEPAFVPAPSSGADGQVQQIWDAHIKVRKFAFDGSFSIHVFIGWVKDEQTERFFTKKNEVGFTGIFAAPQATSTECQSCQKNRADDIVIESVVPLTSYLTDYLDSNLKSAGLITEGQHRSVASLEPNDVVPFLKEQIQWRILDLASSLIVGREQEAHLEVAITHRTFTPPDANNLLGGYGEPTEYPDITTDKAGGLGYVYPAAT
ncbi:common central domain of tyrosinase-domain-containing protein [Lophiotrema nucula]|uniref:tyrosinase n=1 Tax=Lophiotrema nucula TaxID=690887 RepID=A0A6A5ZBE1_9PLEO|nr:common central domain of tyrosinase-domain-containing protein [Lophiotrema nucula]